MLPKTLKLVLVTVAPFVNRDEPAVLEPQILDEAIAPEVVGPVVDDDLDRALDLGVAAPAAVLVVARRRHSDAHGSIFDMVHGRVRIAAQRLHLVSRVTRRREPVAATQTVRRCRS